MRTIILSLIAATAVSAAVGADELPEHLQKVFKKFPSKNGNVIVELRSHPKAGSPNTAMVYFPSTGTRQFLADTETYVMHAQVSDDGRYIVLQYHVSSGGWFEAFERENHGYRKLFDNGYALDEVRAGHVAGFSENDIRETPYRNTFCGLYLGQSPTRLIFTFWHDVELTYSLEQRRITEWQRTLLRFGMTKLAEDHPFVHLKVDELSGERGIALEAFSGVEGDTKHERLVVFPRPQEVPKTDEAATEFWLRSGKKPFIELAAKKVSDDTEYESAKWAVEISGSGQEFEAVRRKLAELWKSVVVVGENDSEWPTPTRFMARPF